MTKSKTKYRLNGSQSNLFSKIWRLVLINRGRTQWLYLLLQFFFLGLYHFTVSSSNSALG